MTTAMTDDELPPLLKHVTWSQQNSPAKRKHLKAFALAAIEQDRARRGFVVPENDIVGISVLFADGHKEQLADVLRELADYRARPVPGYSEIAKLIENAEHAVRLLGDVENNEAAFIAVTWVLRLSAALRVTSGVWR
jgi:hypothetical protein